MANILNRGEIITQGLELGGNTAIGGLAVTFYDTFLDTLYRSHDWEFLLLEGTFSTTAGSELSGTLNPLYRVVRYARMNDSTEPLIQEDYITLWGKIRVAKEAGETGTPTHFATAPDSQNFILYPVPDSTLGGDYVFYSQPAESIGDTAVPAFPDATVLVNAIADFAATYDRDTIFDIVKRNVNIALGKTAANIEDHGRSRPKVLAFDSNHYGTWRGDD